MDKPKYINVMILTGKEAVIIPCLAVVGAASIIVGTGYGIYKIGEKVRNKTVQKGKVFETRVKKRVKEYYDSL